MRPVTPRFLTTVRGSHTAVARARVIPAGLSGTNPGPLTSTGAPLNEITILGGDVKLDATADIQGTLDLTTSAAWPDTAAGLITPFGNEIFVERGIAYGDGTIEWVSLGYYRIYTPEQDTVPGGPIHIVGRDRMSGIIDARPLAPKQYASGTSVQAVFQDLVLEVYPTATLVFDFDAAGTAVSSSHVLEDDRHKFLKDLADSLGKVMYWDYTGAFQVRTAPTTVVPVWAITHGRGGVLVRMSRSLTREGAYNAVVATGEPVGEAPPVRAVSLDLNPNSPTYWYGQFGKVPKFYSSSFLTTTDQCQAAADAMLARQLGVPYTLSLGAVPNCALEVRDPITVSYSDATAPETHVVETLTVPLVVTTPMEGTTKQQLVGGAGSDQ
ncbi:MAG TPA: DUF5047 domain-containing protein [Amycolatopsis sp.]|uniref:DUF5047 domain-containing protein n=1 Tax=Amycolatopsis sp. TaxID=37632 RepID=UPI002B460313|nr:DUF5047 domain-containing protein [Amycolatopsis sp.]HKS46357.1 DUF5047 domain-containing protein [Amycolatopsis sp.]